LRTALLLDEVLRFWLLRDAVVTMTSLRAGTDTRRRRRCRPSVSRPSHTVIARVTNPHQQGGAPTPATRGRPRCETIGADMTAWLSVLVPLLVMFFALGMERVESKLREATLRPEELEELLERPRPDEVRALFRQGTGRALELFRLRNRSTRGRRSTKRSKAA
jgi:hypothetical protein